MVHQKGCDLEGVEGATPPHITHSTHFKLMTTQTFDAQNINEDDLEAVQGGGFWKVVVNGVVGFTPLGPINRISGAFGGPTMGDLVE